MSVAEAEAPLPPVLIRRVINAPREDVFAAWTDPAILAKWFGPPEVTVAQAEIDARVGGTYRIVMRGDSGAINDNYGTYQEVLFPERLVFTWNIERCGGNDPVGCGTCLRRECASVYLACDGA